MKKDQNIYKFNKNSIQLICVDDMELLIKNSEEMNFITIELLIKIPPHTPSHTQHTCTYIGVIEIKV